MADMHDIDEIRELLLPYALGDLSASERARVEQALAADPELREELVMVEQVGARLVAGVAPIAAPAALKGRVLDAVRAGADKPMVEPVANVADLDGARRRRQQASGMPRRSRWFSSPLLTGGLAAACLVLVAVAFNLSGDLDAAKDRASRLADQAERQQPPAGFENAKTFPVGTSDVLEDSRGSLVRVSDDKWIFMIDNVPSPGDGNSWQVWTAHEDGTIQNIAQWSEGDPVGMVVIDSGDITEVMISHEHTTEQADKPSGAPMADVKV